MADKSEQTIGILGISSLFLGAVSLFIGGLASLAAGSAAVAAGFFGIKKHQIFSQAGMMIGAVALIFFNLVSIGIVKAPLSHATGKAHLVDSIYASIDAFEILKKGELDDDDTENIIKHFHNGLRHAALVNIDEINRQVPGFKTHYQDEFIAGMTLLAQGYDTDELSKKIQGGLLMDKWGKWSNENKSRLDKIKEPSVALILFIKRLITD